MEGLIRLKKKITNIRGVSLGEMMVSVLIMSLLTLAISAGAGTAVKVYGSEKARSESRVLSNSVFMAITEEIRYASQWEVNEEGNELHYDSAWYGNDAVMKIQKENDAGGKLVVKYGDGREAFPFEEKTYMGYGIKERDDVPLFQIGGEGSYIQISYDICDSKGKVRTSIEGVRIRLLNR